MKKKTVITLSVVLSFLGLLLLKYEWGVKDKEQQDFQALVAGAKYDAGAKAFVGSCFFIGKYVDADSVEAFKWFQEAADFDLPEASIVVGTLYHLGEGVKLNRDEGMRQFFKAVNYKKEDNIVDIGVKGVEYASPPNRAVLLKYFKKEAAEGNKYAKEVLSLFNEDLSILNKSADQLKKEISAAFDQEDSWIKEALNRYLLKK